MCGSKGEKEWQAALRQTFGMLASQFTHKGTFPDGGKADEAYTGNACPSDIEAGCSGLEFIPLACK